MSGRDVPEDLASKAVGAPALHDASLGVYELEPLPPFRVKHVRVADAAADPERSGGGRREESTTASSSTSTMIGRCGRARPATPDISAQLAQQ
jgi:hypothetical protein